MLSMGCNGLKSSCPQHAGSDAKTPHACDLELGGEHLIPPRDGAIHRGSPCWGPAKRAVNVFSSAHRLAQAHGVDHVGNKSTMHPNMHANKKMMMHIARHAQYLGIPRTSEQREIEDSEKPSQPSQPALS